MPRVMQFNYVTDIFKIKMVQQFYYGVVDSSSIPIFAIKKIMSPLLIIIM